MLGLADAGPAPFAHAALLLCCFDPPKLVFRAEWPTTDFLGTGAGPMAFACRRARAVGRVQPTEHAGGVAVAAY